MVHRGGLDNVRGFIHVKDLAIATAGGREIHALQPLVRPLLALPNRLTLDRVLGQMRDRRARIALVVSEYGDVEGLISLEDIVRELIGELSDEFKSNTELALEPLADGRWRLPGRLPLDEAIEWARPYPTRPFGTTVKPKPSPAGCWSSSEPSPRRATVSTSSASRSRSRRWSRSSGVASADHRSRCANRLAAVLAITAITCPRLLAR